MIAVEPNADFMTVLEQSARQHLLSILKEPRLIDRWMQRQFRGLTYKDIAELEGSKVKPDSIGVFMREQQARIDNLTLSAIMEEALTAYLNCTIPTQNAPSGVLAPGGAARPPLQRTFHRQGGPGEPDIHSPAGTIQVNAKLLLSHRPSWQLPCTPECTAPHGYAVLAELGPPQPEIHIYPLNAQQPLLDTSSVEEVGWDDWIKQLREILEGEGGNIN
jgi:hypothetical protein